MFPLKFVMEDDGVEPWIHMMHDHSEELCRHSILVGELTVAFASYLGLSWADQRLLAKAALLHDVGKLKISAKLLLKPAALTPQEMAEMLLHPDRGHLLLTECGGYEPEVLAVVEQHHERLDGSGYPRGLLATDLSDAVRLVTLCDVYGAITEVRSYDRAYTTNEALQIMAGQTTRLDQRLMKHFSTMAMTVLKAPAPY